MSKSDRGATNQNPYLFFAPKAPRNSYLFAPKARQNHVWPFVFHFLNSPLNPAEIEIRVEALEIKI